MWWLGLALFTYTSEPKSMSPGSTVQAFPKCFCALPGITQLHWVFSSGKYLRLLWPMSSYLISGDFTVPTLPSRAACSAPITISSFSRVPASYHFVGTLSSLTSQSWMRSEFCWGALWSSVWAESWQPDFAKGTAMSFTLSLPERPSDNTISAQKWSIKTMWLTEWLLKKKSLYSG